MTGTSPTAHLLCRFSYPLTMVRPEIHSFQGPRGEDPAEIVPVAPADFGVELTMLIGPEGDRGEESFSFIVCTPSWFATRVVPGHPLPARHYLFVTGWDWPIIETRMRDLVALAEGETWREVAWKVSRVARWEFDGDF